MLKMCRNWKVNVKSECQKNVWQKIFVIWCFYYILQGCFFFTKAVHFGEIERIIWKQRVFE